jgi:hypothetical protein
MNKMSPWACYYGDFQARNYSSNKGPEKGSISAQCTFEHGIYSGPLITSEGEIIIALSESVVFLDNGLNTTFEQTLCTPRALALWKKNKILAGCLDGISCIDGRGQMTKTSLSEEFRKGALTPFMYMTEGIQHRVYALTGDAIFCLDDDLRVSWSENIASKFGLFGGWRMAISDTGEVFVAGAFSWSNEEDQIEHAGYLGAFSPKGEFLWQKNHELDELPTSSGFSLRLSATGKHIWLSDSGVVCFNQEGRELWRSEDEEGTTQFFSIIDDAEVIHCQKQELLAVSEKNGFEARKLLTLKGWPHEIVTDSSRNLYVLGSEGLEAWSHSGEQLFHIPGLIGDKIAVGDGFLIVSSRRGKISVVS